ncbi:MAG: hypothetical protein DRP00_00905 [Candidatus Aenigmatarchaeota archaeon]|nr:MAG: hypothetical protein DRP00_00905 [Candidatus Aenigmarchaeota archaeon]
MTVIVDSCVFISLFTKDKNWEKALTLIELMKEGEKIVIPSLLLPEVCGAIGRITQDRKLAEIVFETIMGWINSGMISVEELNEKRMKKAALIAIEFGIKGGDAIFVSLAKEFHGKLFTFDEKLRRKVKGEIKFLV